MAGYKQTILSLKPKCFVTFDGDTLFETGSWYLRQPHITDESGNGHHAVIHEVDGDKRSYRMGVTSLVTREAHSGQFSFQFTPNSFDDRADHPYEKTLLEIFDHEDFKMKDEFTIMFLFNKKQNESHFQGLKWNYTTSQYERTWTWYKDVNRTIFRKGVKVGLRWYTTYGQGEYLTFTMPSGSVNVAWQSYWYDKPLHITMKREKQSLGGGMYKTIDYILIDGVQYSRVESAITSQPSTGENTSSFELGGTQDNSDPDYLNDRQTTPLTIDQFAFFDFPLTHNQIYDLYKKTKSYLDLIRNDRPNYYLPMDDVKSVNKTYLNDYGTSTRQYTYLIGQNDYQHQRRQDSPPQLGFETSIKFQGGGMLRYRYQPTANHTQFSLSGDYTLEFWCKFTSSSRGVIASFQNEDNPFNGILVQANVRDNQHSVGSIQFSTQDGLYLCTPEFRPNGQRIYYNDDEWRLYHIVRRGEMMEIWIDGVKIAERTMYVNTITLQACYFMGMSPSQLSVDGNLTHVALYSKALQPQQMVGRANFYVKQLIRGRITVQGVPHKALIRVYDHQSGELLITGNSNGDTGDYILNVYTNNYIDIMVLDPNDNNVRYKSFGPLLATTFSDYDYL